MYIAIYTRYIVGTLVTDCLLITTTGIPIRYGRQCQVSARASKTPRSILSPIISRIDDEHSPSFLWQLRRSDSHLAAYVCAPLSLWRLTGGDRGRAIGGSKLISRL